MNHSNKGKRILAIFTLAVLAICLISTLVLAFTGSKYFMVMLFITMALPVLLWVCMFLYKQNKDRTNES